MAEFKISSEMGLITAALTASLMVSLYNIYKHLNNFHEPRFQLYIVRIILIVPVYAVQTYLSILMPKSSLIFNALKDWYKAHHILRTNVFLVSYEAYVLYLFMQLLTQYLGGEQTLVAHYELQGRIKHPWPFTNRLKPIQLNRLFFRRVKQGTLQFVFFRPFISIIALVLHMEGMYEEGTIAWNSAYLYCSFLTNLSVTVSLYSLVLFYTASEERLHIYKPFWKFLMINSIISVAFWQSIVFSIFREFDTFGDHNTDASYQRAFYLENCLLMVEIAVAGVCHYHAFSYREFVDLNKSPRPLLKNLSEILSMKDVLDDAKTSFVDDEKQVDHPMKDFNKLNVGDDEESRIFLMNEHDDSKAI